MTITAHMAHYILRAGDEYLAGIMSHGALVTWSQCTDRYPLDLCLHRLRRRSNPLRGNPGYAIHISAIELDRGHINVISDVSHNDGIILDTEIFRGDPRSLLH